MTPAPPRPARRRSPLRALAAVALLVAPFASSCSEPAATPADASPAHQVGVLPADHLPEASGLAASRRDPDLLWLHNDSGHEPQLVAIGRDGRLRGIVRITGAGLQDWEDMASFTVDGRAWLLVADVGDNRAERHDGGTLFLVPEPDPVQLSPTRPVNVAVEIYMPVRFPGGPRDVESVAVDAPGRRILLVSKRDTPAQVYSLPLHLDAVKAGNVGEAQLVGTVNLPQPTGLAALLPTPTGRYRAQPTALDVDQSGTRALLLTYGDVWVFDRGEEADWAAAFTRGQRLGSPGLVQAEAAAFSADGRHAYVTTEGAPAALLRFDVPPASPAVRPR